MNSQPTGDHEPGSTSASEPAPQPQPARRVVRRRYVIDRRRQFRSAALASGLTLMLLIIVNVAFTMLRNTQTTVLSNAAPELGPILEQQDTRIGAMLAVVSLVFAAGVFVITIAETHRTAGSVFAVHRAVERVLDGDYQTPLRLRPRDTLLDLKDPFNEMVATLRDRAIADADELDRLADEASSATADPAELAARLRALADDKRDIAG